MSRSQALRIAVESIQCEIRRLNIEANPVELVHADHGSAINAWRKREQLREAMIIVKGLMKGVI
jgi:hypothetical protein